MFIRFAVCLFVWPLHLLHLQAPDWLSKAKGRNMISLGRANVDNKKKEIKPNWSGKVSLKKTERKSTSEQEDGAKQDWRGQLKKSSPKSPGFEKEDGQQPAWKGVSLRSTPGKRQDEED